MTPRRPHPGPPPTAGAWWTVVGAMGFVIAEIIGQGCRLVGFVFTRGRWRREVARRVRRGALPPPPRIPAGADRERARSGGRS